MGDLTPGDMSMIAAAVKAAVQAAVGASGGITFMPGTVTVAGRNLGVGTAMVVTDDDPTAAPIPVQVLVDLALLPGDRVMIARVPPAGAFIVGAGNGGYTGWQYVGAPGQPALATGWSFWGTLTVPPSSLAFRREGQWVAMRSTIQAVHGLTVPSLITTLPFIPQIGRICYCRTNAGPEPVYIVGALDGSGTPGQLIYQGTAVAVDSTMGGYLDLSLMSYLLN